MDTASMKNKARHALGWTPTHAPDGAGVLEQLVDETPVPEWVSDDQKRDEALALVAGIFNMQLHAPSADGFACPFPGLTTLQEIALHYVTPALVGVLLLLRYHGERCAHRSSKRAAAAVMVSRSLHTAKRTSASGGAAEQ